jgi:hypothetical protein
VKLLLVLYEDLLTAIHMIVVFVRKFSIKLVNAYVKFTANVCFTVFHSVMAAKDEFLYLLCKWVVYLNLFLQFVIPTTHI